MAKVKILITPKVGKTMEELEFLYMADGNKYKWHNYF